MATRIIIQHLAGSKVNQVEQFPLEGLTEITVGRDPSSTVAFDPQRDDAVSRRHSVITVHQGERPSFRIADLGSRNGTRVNGEPIAGEIELLPGDIIECGRGGPKFSFDVQPPLPHLLSRTRVVSTTAPTSAAAGATRVLDVTSVESTAVATTPSAITPAKRSVGRETVMGMLASQRQQTNRNWMYILAGVLVLIGAGGASLHFYQKHRAQEAAAAAAAALAQEQEARRQSELKLASATAAVRTDMGISPQEIVRKYGNAVVVIDVHWRAYDKATGKPLYHMTKTVGNEHLPCFVELPNGAILRWLTTEDQNQTNLEVGGAGKGSGFVISDNGFILTNKHVAAGWMTRYGEHEQWGKALLFKIGSAANPRLVDSAAFARTLYSWTPGEAGGVVFRVDRPEPVDGHVHEFESRNDLLEIRFPGSILSISAHLIRYSTVADVAEIKIDTQQTLATVGLAQDDNVKVGEKVTVLGYPAFSTQAIAVIQSAEAG
ncbi:MAG: FHA domain-containing protein, partial [Acetobacteraceae bacterium]|nr:FHA domain-containing protein [Acetobacteraceae bacterium]